MNLNLLDQEKTNKNYDNIFWIDILIQTIFTLNILSQ